MPNTENLCSHRETINDDREGTVVCVNCGFVLSDQLYQSNYCFHENNKEEDQLENKVRDILDKLNLPSCFVVDIMRKYAKMEKRKYLLEYLVYSTLHDCGFPISIKDISCVTGISDSKIYQLQGKDESICLQAENLIEKYCTLLNFDYKTYSLIKAELPIVETGHNPLTIIASTIYKYCKRKKIKLSMRKIANVINISTVSIQRYIKKC